MKNWVLRHTADGSKHSGRYVAEPGSEHSYTRSLERAQRFTTAEQARDAACPESEYPVNIEDLLSNR